MKKSLLSLCAAVLAISSLTSCMPKGTTEITVPIEYANTDLLMGYTTTGQNPLLTTTAPQLTIVRSINESTLSFRIGYLLDPNTFANISLATDPLKYTTQNDQLLINLPSVTTPGGTVLQNFSFIGYYNWMSLSFTLNGTTYYINTKSTLKVQVLPGTPVLNMVVYDGDTKITDTPFDPDGYTPEATSYGVVFENSNTASVYMMDAQFASAMLNPVQIVIPNLKYQMTDTGYYIYSEGSIIPENVTESGNDPFPMYVINNFSATLPYTGKNGTLSFKCSEGNWSVGATNLSIAPGAVLEGSTN